MSTVKINNQDVSILTLKKEALNGIDMNSQYKFLYNIIVVLIDYILKLEDCLIDEVGTVENEGLPIGDETEKLRESHNLEVSRYYTQ